MWFDPVKSTKIFSGCLPDFFLIYKYKTQLISGCSSEKKSGSILQGRYNRVDFTGHPSNQFSWYSLNFMHRPAGVKYLYLFGKKVDGMVFQNWQISENFWAAQM